MNFLLRLLITVITIALFWSAGTCLAQSAPEQAINTFTARDAATAVGEALIKAGAGNEIKVHITGVRDEDTLVTAPHPVTARVDNLDLDKAHNHWQATLLLAADGKNLAPIKLAGNYDEMTQVPVLRHSMGKGEVISQDDIDWSQEPTIRLHKTTITDASEMIGKSPKRVISQGRPVRLDEVASPAIINKGAHITLLYKSQNLEIRTLGEAMDSGAKGDVIRVKNLASKSIIEGTVEAGDSVRVTSPDATSAEAM